MLAAGNGDPLIVEQPIRKGRVVLVATSADLSWTHALLAQLRAPGAGDPRLVRRRPDPAAERRGGRAAGRRRWRPRPVDVPLLLNRPDGQSRQIALHAEGDYGVVELRRDAASGIYTATLGPPVAQRRASP